MLTEKWRAFPSELLLTDPQLVITAHFSESLISALFLREKKTRSEVYIKNYLVSFYFVSAGSNRAAERVVEARVTHAAHCAP
jgi:hypothetical protein